MTAGIVSIPGSGAVGSTAPSGQCYTCFFQQAVWLSCMFGHPLCIDVNVLITRWPGNVTRSIGQSVTFCCHYFGTRDLPLWKINGTLYLSSDLPYGHRLTFSGLQVEVREPLNHAEYRCAISTFRGRLIKVQSPAAFLTVLQTLQPNTSKWIYMFVAQ